MTLLSRESSLFSNATSLLRAPSDGAGDGNRGREGREDKNRDRAPQRSHIWHISFLDLLAAVGVGRGLQLVDLRSILGCVEEVESTAVCNENSVTQASSEISFYCS